MKKWYFTVCAALCCIACEKEVSIDLNSSDPQVVIEGIITDQPGPYRVTISKTVNFNTNNNYPGVSGALVIISDNTGVTDTLSEVKPGTYQTNRITGRPGITYHLNIEAEGKKYAASSTMPEKVNLEVLKFNKFSSPASDDGYTIVPVYADPPVPGNCYRFVQTVNGMVDESYFVFDDIVSNGSVNSRPIFNPDLETNLGDSVEVEMRCIDQSTYTYFYTLSQISDEGPGGGTTPSNPPNNITGNKALGYFSAYTTQTFRDQVK